VHHSRQWHRIFEKIQFGPVPVVSHLKGAVIGGGIELATATHIRVAEPTAYYALPEGQRGIYTGGGASVRLTRLIGVDRMMDMMLTGRTYSAEEGQTLGLSQYLVPAGEGLAKAMALAERISTNVGATNFALIQALPRIAETNRETGFMMESLIAAIAQAEPDAKSRLRAFLEGRAAKIKPQD
jgi:(methylthio)acryloyl-CoA hydratase